MAGQEVKVALGLDTTAADAALSAFFTKLKTQKPESPFKSFGADFAEVEKKAKSLGLTWDDVSKKFKNNIGESFKTDTVVSALKQLDSTARASGKTLDAVASDYKGFAGTLDFTGNKLTGFGQTVTSTRSTISGLNFGPVSQQLKQLGQVGTTAGQGVASAAAGFNTAGSGLKTLGSEATTTAGKFGGLTGAATKTAGSLKDIGGKSDGLSKLAKDANATEGELRQTAEAAVRLDSAVKNAGKTTALPALKASLGGVKAEAGSAAAGFGPLADAVTKAGQSGDKLTAIPKALQGAIAPAQAAAKGVASIGQSADESQKKVGRFTETLRSGFKNVVDGIPQGIGLAIGNLLLAPLAQLGQVIPAAVREFSDLDAAIRMTLSIAGEGPEKFGALQQMILEVGAASAATTAEVGEVAKSLARAGFDLEQINQATGPIVQGAEATGTAYATMGDIVASALGQFKLTAADTSDVVDTLVTAANNANQSIADIGEALKYVGPVANSTGQSLQDVVLTLGLLANAGIKGSTAGTSLRTLLTNLQIAASGASDEFSDLSRGSGKLSAALKLIGADVTGANGALKTGKDLIYSLQDSFLTMSRGETAIISKVLAGSEGLPTLTTLIGATGDEIESLASSLDGRFGVAASAQQAAMDGLSGAFRQLDGAVSTALAGLGSFVAVALTPLILAVTGVINAFSGLPAPIQAILLSLATLGAATGAIVIAMKLFAAETEIALGAAIAQKIAAIAAALTAANVGATLRVWADAAMAFGAAIRGQMITGLAGATGALNRFNTAVASGSGLTALSNYAQGVVSGFKGIGSGAVGAASGVATVAKASADATGSLTMMTKAGAVAAPWLAEVAVAAPAAGAGAAAAGAGAAGAGVGFGALAASLGAFLVAAAPVILAVGAIVAVIALAKTAYDSYAKVGDALSASQKKLAASLKEPKKGAEDQEKTVDALGISYRSWGKSITDFFGPFDQFMSKLFPAYELLKLTAEAVGLVVDKMKDVAGETAAAAAQAEFAKALGDSNAKIDENLKKMKGLSPASAEYAKLANDNVRLERAQVTATEERIGAIDKLLQGLRLAPEANAGQIASLESERNSLTKLLPDMRARQEALVEEARQARIAAGANADLGRTLADVSADRAKALKDIDTTAYVLELKALSDLKDGLISESEQRAISAKITVDTAQAKLDADEAALQESKKLLDEGTITQAAYDQKLSEFTEKHKDRLKERAQAEIDLKAAVAAAVDARLQEYEREQQQIAANVQRVNQTLGEIGSIGSAGISAFKALGDSIASYELGIIDRNKAARLKAIDEAGARDKERISNSGLDEQGKAQETAALESKLATDKASAEAEFAAQKRAIVQQQLELELASIEATKGAKLAELEIWRVEKQIATEMAIIQNEIAQTKAKAAGDTKLLAALQAESGLLQQQKGLIGDAYGLKQQIIGIEQQTSKVAVANKAAQEGISSAISGQAGSIGSVKAQMDGFNTKVEGLQQKWLGVRDRVSEVAASTTEKMNRSFSNVDPSIAAKVIAGTKFVGPETTAKLTEELTGGLRAGATQGTAQASQTINNGLSGPAIGEGLSKGLSGGLTKGAETGSAAAQASLKKIDTAIPVESIQKRLGDALRNPFTGLAATLAGFNPIAGLVGAFKSLGDVGNSIIKLGLSKELNSAARFGGNLAGFSSSIGTNITQAIGPAIRLAQALERAARAAAATKASRWTGGPVTGGQSYTVNELGREMFLSNAGALSEIRTPAFGQWRAPSSGTVIPASISQQIRQGAKSQEVAASMRSLPDGRGGTGGMTVLNQGNDNLQRQLIREIQKLDGGQAGNQVNNINITSERPVNDASQMLVDLARRRALRRR